MCRPFWHLLLVDVLFHFIPQVTCVRIGGFRSAPGIHLLQANFFSQFDVFSGKINCKRVCRVRSRSITPGIRHWSQFYRPQTKLRKGNVFTPVCHSVHRGSAPVRAGIHPPETHTLGRHRPGHPPPPGRRLLLRTVRILLECILVCETLIYDEIIATK